MKFSPHRSDYVSNIFVKSHVSIATLNVASTIYVCNNYLNDVHTATYTLIMYAKLQPIKAGASSKDYSGERTA